MTEFLKAEQSKLDDANEKFREMKYEFHKAERSIDFLKILLRIAELEK